MDLRVKSLQRTCTVSVSPNCTVSQLLQICKVAESRTVLFRGLPLRKDQSLDSADIQTGAVLLLVSPAPRLEEVPIRIRRLGKTCSMHYTEKTTVADIKQRWGEEPSIRPDAFKVIYRGSELSDSTILTDCVAAPYHLFTIEKVRIPTGDTFSVFVKTLTGRYFSIGITSAMTITEVKELISEHECLAIETVRLICAGHCLSDDETVGLLGLLEGSTLHLILRLR